MLAERWDQRGQIIFPSNSLGDIELFHNFAEWQLRDYSEDKQNDKLITYGK